MPPPGSTSAFPWSYAGSNQTDFPGQHFTNNGNQTHFGIPATMVHQDVKSTATKPSKRATASMHGHQSATEEKRRSYGVGMTGTQVKSENTDDKASEKYSSRNAQQRRNRKKVVSDSDSAESNSSESDESDVVVEEDSTVPDVPTNSRYPRRSTRCTVKVSYKVIDSEDDDDFVFRPKKSRKLEPDLAKFQDVPSSGVANGLKTKASDTPTSKEETKQDHTGVGPCEDDLPRRNAHGKESNGSKKDERQVRARSNTDDVESRCRAPNFGSSFSCPDSEFYDFEKDRHQSKFSVNQIWAAYDDHDAMPRFYALIQRVFTPFFKLQYTWLEFNPSSAIEKAWVNTGLPTACGNFTPGRTGITTSEQIFSHLISYETGNGKSYNVHPKKDEVWALFKDWDVGWSSSSGGPRNMNFTYGQDITVSHLVKVKGHLYLFAKVHDEGLMQVPSGQLLRFSHRVPYYRVGKGDGIPRNSFELDPAALPPSSWKITDTAGADAIEVPERPARPRENPHVDLDAQVSEENRRSEAMDHSDQDPGSLGMDNNDEQEFTAEFYNFEEERSEEKFKQGQIWAIYSDIDEYPNYYGLIKEADWEGAGFEKTLYEIYPNIGDVWAVLKNGSGNVDGEKASDYGIVQIIEQDNFLVKAIYLAKVKGYKYVFMPETGSLANIKIPMDECLRFSHQVPAFRLTDQGSGKLKDCFELDPDSIPKMLLSKEC
ncbi:hypothetical protein HPP92_016001 [Vanilla planifolia]|uniref:DUF3444 domain-containing protein n=1 Tax=Vanilla planifolia TaxID=51239 RepID=A0A835USJ9_VANPL|nr:hypothetical protein HPP92_016001 [Vanilla planifolia]